VVAKNKNKNKKKRTWREFWGLVWLRMQEVKVKVGVFIFLVLYVCFLIWSTYNEFRCNDPIPNIQIIELDMRKQFRDISAKIRVGMHITRFKSFSFSKNTFIFDTLIWFEFKKNEIQLDSLDNFSFDNAKILTKSKPLIKLLGDSVLAKYYLTLDAKTNLSFRDFPLEDHRLSLVLNLKFTSPHEIHFGDERDSISFSMSSEVSLPNWKLYRVRKKSGKSELFFDQFKKKRRLVIPKAVFSLDFARDGLKSMLIIFVPIFAALFLSLFTFMMSFNNYIGKFSLSVTSLTALLGYRFVIEQLVPNVGYLTLTDKLYLFFLLFIFCVFIFQLLLVRQYLFLVEGIKNPKPEMALTDKMVFNPRETEKINTLAYFLFVGSFLFVVSYLLL